MEGAGVIATLVYLVGPESILSISYSRKYNRYHHLASDDWGPREDKRKTCGEGMRQIPMGKEVG